MIDVVMCLIVFFLIVGRLAADQRTPVSLPRSHSGEEGRVGDRVFVSAAPDDSGRIRVRLDGAELEEEAVESRVRERMERTPATVVHLRADRTLPFGRVRGLIEACRAAGAAEVRFDTERSP